MQILVYRITTVPVSLKVLLKGQLKFLKNNGLNVVGISSPGDELLAVEKDENVNTIGIHMTRNITLISDLYALVRLFLLFRRTKPSIVHTHTPKAGTLGMIAAWLARVPVRLHTVAGLPLLEAKGLNRRLLTFVEKITYRCANYIYPNSYVLNNFIIQQGYTHKNKLYVLANGSSNGIDTTHFSRKNVSEDQIKHLQKTFKINKDDFVFIFVGRLVGDKGINELISAFKSINVDSGVKLILVGPFETELDPLLPQTIAEVKSNPNIISVGFQEDVRPYFAISDCLVFPSYREGFPNVVMQAGAMELPAIVTDINGCNEIIEEGKNGLIIPPKNVDALRVAMEKIVIDQTLYSQLKEHARPMITSRYEQQVVWNAILEEYNRLLIEKGFK